MSAAIQPRLSGEAGVSASGLWHRYTAARALEPVSFSVSSPGVVAVTGATGSGKSTLLRIIAGLLRPSGGSSSITLDGAELPHAGRSRHLGYAAPELAFYDELSVSENLEFAAEARGLAGRDAAVSSVLMRLSLAARANERASALSSGLKQRLRLAFALLHQPALLLLDEPGSHMDDEGRAVLYRIIEHERSRGLVIIATNDEREWALAEQRIELRGRGLGDTA